MLIRERPVANHAEHLRAFEHEPHGAASLLRGHRGEYDMRPHRTLASKPAADERADHADVFLVDAQGFRNGAAGAGNALGRIVEREVRTDPARERGVWLHRIVMLV